MPLESMLQNVYTSSAPATHRMGMPTHLRHSSTRERMPIIPITVRVGVIFDALVSTLMIASKLNA